MANDNLTQKIVEEILKLNEDGSLYHRESTELEFKEQFNFAGLADYLRDFAAFANNVGGYIVFGVSESPRRLLGLSENSLKAFDGIDPEQISRDILDIFSSNIYWDFNIFKIGRKHFGVFRVEEAINKPVIAKKNAGRDQTIKNADIYYRYGGRTQKIQYAELENIIQKRIDAKSREWQKFVSSMSKITPESSYLITPQSTYLGKSDSNILYMDEQTAKDIDFIKEGEFKEKQGAKAIKIIGEAKLLGAKTIEKIRTESLLEAYPLTYTQLITEIKNIFHNLKQSDVHEIIRENNIKNDRQYSVYNFRSKRHADKYEETGVLETSTPSIYNHNCFEFIVKLLEDEYGYQIEDAS